MCCFFPQSTHGTYYSLWCVQRLQSAHVMVGIKLTVYGMLFKAAPNNIFILPKARMTAQCESGHPKWQLSATLQLPGAQQSILTSFSSLFWFHSWDKPTKQRQTAGGHSGAFKETEYWTSSGGQKHSKWKLIMLPVLANMLAISTYWGDNKPMLF